jgi:hypothetical protein
VRRPHFPDLDLDRSFDGELPKPGDSPLTSQLGQAKETLTRQPRPEVAAAHVAQITEAARGLAARGQPRIVEVAPRGRSGLRALRQAAVTFAVLVFASASSLVGLAYAGVQLPSAVLTAFNGIGVHLPNQGQGSAATSTPSSSLQHGQDIRVIATTGPHGCVHGRGVSAVAGSGSQAAHADGHRQNADHQTADPCAQGQQSGSGSQSSGTSTGTQQQDAGSSTSGTTISQTHRTSSGDGSSTTPTHGRSGKTGNQGLGEGGSRGPNDHSSESNGNGKSPQHGRS